MGCGSTEAVLDRVADWLVLTTEDKPWVAGVGCTAARLDFFLGGSHPAGITTALAEGLRRRVERFGGILSLQKTVKKKHTRYYLKQYFHSENRTINRTCHGEKNKNGKESLSGKQSTQQLTSYAKIKPSKNC